MTEEPGTEIREACKVEDLYVSGVAVDRDVAQISVLGIKNQPGAAYKIFSLLADKKISVDVILQNPGMEAITDISFTVAKQSRDEALAVLTASQGQIGYKAITNNDSLAKLSIVGAGMTTAHGVASGMFEALYENNINIIMISTSEIKVTVLVDDHNAEKAMQVVHDKFVE